MLFFILVSHLYVSSVPMSRHIHVSYGLHYQRQCSLYHCQTENFKNSFTSTEKLFSKHELFFLQRYTLLSVLSVETAVLFPETDFLVIF